MASARAGDILVGMRRSGHEYKIGAGDGGAGIIGDERKPREAIAERAFIFDAADSG
jgi:hypothetical protein